MVDFWVVGVYQRLFGPSAAVPPEKKKTKIVTPIEPWGVLAVPLKEQGDRQSKTVIW